mmetsp:Transcript_16790/g.26190  ORF Transcript_16790/g.26190 Transcript_16790/m.26190 type:complete len:100 (+) Transcript_16790:97-396(+)
MSNIISDLLSPGGGILLIPFIRVVVMCLLTVCVGCFIAGVARIHMFILSFLSGGLLISLSFFQAEYNRVHNRRHAGADDATGETASPASSISDSQKKTD